MGRFIAGERSICYKQRDEVVLVESYGEGCIRVRATRNSKVSDEKWTLLDPVSTDCVITKEENKLTLTTGNLRAELTPGWQTYTLAFYKNDKKILQTIEKGDAVNKYMHIEGDHYRIRAQFASNNDEHFFGLGQEQQDWFDRKGGAYELAHHNTKSTLPFVYSSLGYGFLWNNPAPGHCELAKNHTLWQSDSAYQADYLILGGETPADVMKQYGTLTGFAPKFPEWATGFWQCKLRYESQEDLLNVAREYKKRGIPIAAIVIDFFHWTEQGDWQFEPSLWPDPKAMCDELREMGIRPVVSIWPTINPASKNYNRMNDENMLVRTENGQYGTFEFHGQQAFVDMMNPDARSFVWEQAKKNYYDYGIKTFWLDEAEPEVHPQQFHNLKFYLGNGAQTALLYPYYYVKCFYDGLKEEGEETPVSLTRAAYPGSQRIGAIVWNGDIASNFDALRQSVVSGLSMAVCGIPWWNSDIGGFHSGNIESDYFRELIVRWFQFGLFCPVMRLHGVRIKPVGHVDRHPGVLEPSGGDNEIWSFGERNYPILKHLIELREKLRPYIQKQMDENSKTGMPIMRPLFFEDPEDKTCYEIDDAYLFGNDIYFAPIVNEGQTERQVYLPKGEWINVNDHKTYVGGQWYTFHAKLEEFIALVRKGSSVSAVFDI